MGKIEIKTKIDSARLEGGKIELKTDKPRFKPSIDFTQKPPDFTTKAPLEFTLKGPKKVFSIKQKPL